MINYCRKCHDKKRIKNYNDVIVEIENITAIPNSDDKCISYCGPGSNNFFIMHDDEIIEDPDYKKFIEKIKEVTW